MPLRLHIRRRAENDILRIVRYVARKNRASMEAERLGYRLVTSCESLLAAPHKGAPSDLGPDVRKINEGPYKIIYRVTPRHVIILRIWDGRRGNDPRL